MVNTSFELSVKSVNGRMARKGSSSLSQPCSSQFNKEGLSPAVGHGRGFSLKEISGQISEAVRLA